MSNQRRGGIIQLQVNGVLHDAKGSFTCGLGRPKREGIVGSDHMHGFKETPQVGFLEGAITDRGDLDLDALYRLKDATITLEKANGKVFVLRNAYYAGDTTDTTDEGEVAVRFEGDAEEI